MTTPPPLTDRIALHRNRVRAAKAPGNFLHNAAVEEVKDRLSLVNKSFTRIAIVTGHPDVWQMAFPDALCVPDDDTLGLEQNAHDLVIHAMNLHWANDPVGQIIQCRRALQPDGLFLACLFGGATLHELRACLAHAEADISGGLSPRVAPMGEIRDLGGLLQRAGFALPVADSVPIKASYSSLESLAGDLRAMGEGNAIAARPRQFARRDLFTHTQNVYRDSFATSDGRLPATFEVIFLTGWAPDASQPQPLRPGSAAARLADALGTRETQLDD